MEEDIQRENRQKYGKNIKGKEARKIWRSEQNMKQLLQNMNRLLHERQQNFKRHHYTKNSSTDAISQMLKKELWMWDIAKNRMNKKMY